MSLSCLVNMTPSLPLLSCPSGTACLPLSPSAVDADQVLLALSVGGGGEEECSWEGDGYVEWDGW